MRDDFERKLLPYFFAEFTRIMSGIFMYGEERKGAGRDGNEKKITYLCRPEGTGR